MIWVESSTWDPLQIRGETSREGEKEASQEGSYLGSGKKEASREGNYSGSSEKEAGWEVGSQNESGAE